MAVHAGKTNEKKIHATKQGGSISGRGTIVEIFGIKIATDWAGKEDWISERKKGAFADKTKIVILALDSIKLSTEHRREKGEVKERKLMRRHRGVWDPRDTTIHTREEGPTVQLREDSEVASKWISGQYSQGQKYRGRIGQVQKTMYS